MSGRARVGLRNVALLLFAVVGVVLLAPQSAHADTNPTAPTGVSVTAYTIVGDGKANVSWTASSSDGGSPLTYTVTSSPGGLTGSTTGTSKQLTGLTPGTAYTFTVTATNQSSLSATSDPSNAVTPPVAPGAPSGVTAVRNATTPSTIDVSWSAPSNWGSLSGLGYRVIPRINGVDQSSEHFTWDADVTSHSFTDLAVGTPYTFKIVAVNGYNPWGESAPGTSGAVTPMTAPSAPTSVSVSAHTIVSDGKATVSWTAPSNNGGSALTYTVTSSPAGFTGTTSATSKQFTGLTPGTAYSFTVTATNQGGYATTSAPTSSVTPPVAPSAPSGVTAVRNATTPSTIDVSWSAPSSWGSLSGLGYRVIPRINGVDQPSEHFTWDADVTSHSFTGLTVGTAYTFKIVAVNGYNPWGESAGAVSSAVTPMTAPSAPTGVSVTAHTIVSDGKATVSWTAPSNNGGSALTYTVTSSPAGFTGTTAGTSKQFTGLTPGTAYTFTVTATNQGGYATTSSASSPVAPPVAPTAPQNVSATGGAGTATVTWDAPSSWGSLSGLGYRVIPVRNGVELGASEIFTWDASVEDWTFTGLTAGTYTFKLIAVNGYNPWGESATVSSNAVSVS